VLVKIGAGIVRHGRYVVFQLAEVAVARALFGDIFEGSTASGQGRSQDELAASRSPAASKWVLEDCTSRCSRLVESVPLSMYGHGPRWTRFHLELPAAEAVFE
jgi:hypothetical protein